MNETATTRGTWRRLQGYAWPYRHLLALAALAMLLEAAVSAAVVKLQQPIIDDLLVAKDFNGWLPVALVLLGLLPWRRPVCPPLPARRPHPPAAAWPACSARGPPLAA